MENFTSTGSLGTGGSTYAIGSITVTQQIVSLFNGKLIGGTSNCIVVGYEVSASGSVQDYGWAACLNIDTATLNTSWGTSGVYFISGVTDSFNGWGGVATDPTNQTSYLLGWATNGSNAGTYSMVSARFLGSGAIDSNYGYNGIAYTSPPNPGYLYMSPLGNGEYIFKGQGGEMSTWLLVMVKRNRRNCSRYSINYLCSRSRWRHSYWKFTNRPFWLKTSIFRVHSPFFSSEKNQQY